MKTERFEMRLDRETLDRVDAWRSEQQDLPSRAEAVRQLVGVGLTVRGKGDFRISSGEMLILMMMRDLYKHLGVEGEIDPDFVEKTIGGGHYWGLGWNYSGLFHGHVDNQQVVDDVVNMLDMWEFIEIGYANLSDNEKSVVEEEVASRGKAVMFPGFDANNESEHYFIARYLINDLDRFQKFKGRELNSHFPHMETYRRMWQEFEPMRATLIGRNLSCSEIVALLKV